MLTVHASMLTLLAKFLSIHYYRDFWDILFKETLVLTQAQGFEDEYDSEKYR